MGMMKTVTTCLGAFLCLTAVIGFFDHDFMGMMLNPIHDSFLLVMGLVTLYFGVNGTEFQARYMCRFAGCLFAFLGIATLLAKPGIAKVDEIMIEAPNVLKLMPNILEYTTADGWRDLFAGVVGIVAGFFPREQEIEMDMKAQEMKQKQKVGNAR